MSHLPGLYKVIPRGDGSYLLVPEKPAANAEITVSKAAELLDIDLQGVARLIQCGLLEARKPTPRKILISLDSVLKHKEATKDPDFWTKHKWLNK